MSKCISMENCIRVTAGDLYFLSPNVPHALKNIGKEQCEYFAFQWKDQ